MKSKYLIVITTIDTFEDANALSDKIVGKRLAACAQVVGPITSTYWWDGKMEREDEWKISFKTSTERYSELEAELSEIHPYDAPEIIAIPIADGSREYLDWIGDEMKKDKS